MTRRSFLLRNVRTPEPDPEIAEKYLRHWHSGDLYANPESFPQISSEGLFGDTKPMELEIGAGTGEFLCHLASEHSEANFVGVDINLKSLWAGVETARSRSLENIKFIKAPVQFLYPLLSPRTLRAVYLHFPDPCLRPKYRDRRIFNASFLDYMYMAMSPGARLSVATDVEEVVQGMLALAERDPRFRKTHKEKYLLGFEPAMKSRYQTYWEQHGLVVYRFELERNP